MNRLVRAALAAAPLLAAAQDATTTPAAAPLEAAPAPAAPASPLREGVYLGVGVGASELLSPDKAVFAYRIRVGVTRSPRLQFGLEMQRAEDRDAQLSFTDVSATFFPLETTLFVRGGFGFSSLYRTHSVYTGYGWYPETTGGSGINVLAGVGAQLGHPDGFNMTLNLEAQGHRIRAFASDGLEHEASLSGWLGFEWH